MEKEKEQKQEIEKEEFDVDNAVDRLRYKRNFEYNDRLREIQNSYDSRWD